MVIERFGRGIVRSWTGSHPAARRWVAVQGRRVECLRHSVARHVPGVIRPRPRNLTVAVTARCNLRCAGCRYGRDFMPGQELALPMMVDLLDDARQAGVDNVRLYGGEPLLHQDLPRIVEHAVEKGLDPYVTTNAVLLGDRIDDLYAAGLRFVTIGFYGVDEAYDSYVARAGAFRRVERSIAAVRDRYGDQVVLRLNWLLMRPSCNRAALDAALALARRHRVAVSVDLIHYSLPYFSEGEDRELQFRAEDRPRIEALVDELLAVHRAEPGLIDQTELGLRSIPDWLLEGPRMRVPCDKYKMLWVGADGSVQLCYVTFPLGNLHQNRLRDLVFTAAHADAARGAFRLDCPNCHCGYDDRVSKDAASRRRYAGGN